MFTALLHYLDWGSPEKPPMILLHGIGRVAHTFDHIAPHFAANYHVMAVDMRGHGDSGWDPKGEYLVEDYVKDIEGMAEQLGLQNIVIWGNSTGGRVAQVFAALHPERTAVISKMSVRASTQVAVSVSRQLKQEDETGWASEEALLAQPTSNSGRRKILRAYAHYGSKKR
jgi:pimeloyl-ACP methyl ester carboxylesterase